MAVRGLADIFAPYNNPYRIIEEPARPMPVDRLNLPPEAPVKTGRWDPKTGTIVYEDGTETISSVIGTAQPKRRDKATTEAPPQEAKAPRLVEPKLPKPPKERKGRKKGTPPHMDPRREKIIELWQAGKSLTFIKEDQHIDKRRLNAIITGAGFTLETRRAELPSRYGEANNFVKITNEIALAIFNSTGTAREIGPRFGVSDSLVKKIKNGNLWGHVTGKVWVRQRTQRRGTAAD